MKQSASSFLLTICLALLLPAFAAVANAKESPVPTLAVSGSGLPSTSLPTGGSLRFLEGGGVLWAVDSSGWVGWLDGSEWKKTSRDFGRDTAFAASPDGLIALGGEEAGGVLSSAAFLLRAGGTASELPSFPEGVVGASAVVLDDVLYVIGGRLGNSAALQTTPVWTLDLNNLPAGWVEGEALPGRARANSAISAHNRTITVSGGVCVSENSLLNENWSFRRQPVEGTSARGWKRLADLPEALDHPVAAVLGQVQLIVAETGGRGATSHPMFAYNLVTDAWTPFQTDVALAPFAFGNRNSALLIGSADSGELFSAKPETTLRRFGWVDYSVIALYFIILGVIGSRFTRQESSEEFTLGNRQVKWWAAGISMFATSASAISFMAVPALAFSTNLVWFLPVLLLIPSYFITAYFIYPLLRRLNITSTYEYLEQRFNRTLRLLASGQCILLQTFGRGSVVLLLPALAISLITGLDVLWAVTIMGVCTLIYTVSGGFEAVIWTEVFQAVLMFLAPVVIIVTALVALPGGFGEFWQTGTTYAKFDIALLTWDVTVPALWIMLLSGFVTTVINPAGDQPVIQRVFSSPLAEVRKVNATSNVCGIVIGLLTQGMGLVLFAYFHRFPQQFVPESQLDQLVPLYVTQAMPVGFGGVIVAAIFAAAMSTVASATNSVATIYVEDFHPKSRTAKSPEGQVRLLRFVSLLVGVIATVTALALGLFNMKSLMIFWAQIMALLGGGFVGVYILGMFTKRTNGFGAVAGALMSIVVAMVLKYFTSAHWALYFPAAALSCIAFGYFFSLFRPAPVLRPGLTVYHPVPDAESKAAA